jgi:hypothetical protein
MHMRSAQALGFAIVGAALAVGCLEDSEVDGKGASVAGDYTFCGALTATCGFKEENEDYVGIAGGPNGCLSQALAQCSTLQSQYSDAFQSAVVACAKTYSPCDPSNEPVVAGPTFVSCVGAQIASATPTAAQAKVKADFCAMYASGTNGDAGAPEIDCASFFPAAHPDAGAAVAGPGYLVLIASDSVAAEIDKCIPPTATQYDGVACSGLGCFKACAEDTFAAAVTPAGCTGAGG